eukprot:NODE_1227_length_1597_cov_16.436054_g1157_i0.p1 GENE.NODE_1227_length_1597_cov_16.436054_g1157_i0~~NODE_1227_length_1597_cov_16.436054_g1157_i0.p1  ORF type:complete len:486 (+),score=117.20 NODE_1227_length_1597_cov_16.436054_g1157_i0:34-1458(+)
MRVLVLTYGTRGDVQPYVALGSALLAAGHDCSIATHPTFKPFIEELGVSFVPYHGPHPQEMFDYCVRVGIFGRDFMREITHLAHNFMDAWAQVCRESIGKYDIILSTFTCIDHGVHIAEASGIPVCIAHYVPLGETAHFFSPYAPALLQASTINPSWRNLLSHVLIDTLLGFLARPKTNQLRKELGLPALGGWLKWTSSWPAKQAAPRLYGYSAALLPPPLDWPDQWPVVGYWWLPEAPYTPPSDLATFLEGPPPIYVGYGSVNVPSQLHLLKIIVDAIALTKHRAIIHTSSKVNMEVPADILFLTANVPHSWLFPKVRLAIHHGGAGTVAYALKAGIPSIIMPFFGDHYLWAQRLHEIGCGPPALSPKAVTPPTMAHLIRSMLEDDTLRANVLEVSAKMQQEDGKSAAIDLLTMLYHEHRFPSTRGHSAPPTLAHYLYTYWSAIARYWLHRVAHPFGHSTPSKQSDPALARRS